MSASASSKHTPNTFSVSNAKEKYLEELKSQRIKNNILNFYIQKRCDDNSNVGESNQISNNQRVKQNINNSSVFIPPSSSSSSSPPRPFLPNFTSPYERSSYERKNSLFWSCNNKKNELSHRLFNENIFPFPTQNIFRDTTKAHVPPPAAPLNKKLLFHEPLIITGGGGEIGEGGIVEGKEWGGGGGERASDTEHNTYNVKIQKRFDLLGGGKYPRMRPHKTCYGLNKIIEENIRLQEEKEQENVRLFDDGQGSDKMGRNLKKKKKKKKKKNILHTLLSDYYSSSSSTSRSSSSSSLHIHNNDNFNDVNIYNADTNTLLYAKNANENAAGGKRNTVGGGGASPLDHNTKRCVPLYTFKPTICEQSKKIAEEKRTKKLEKLWQKIDKKNEGVVNMFEILNEGSLVVEEKNLLEKYMPTFICKAHINKNNEDIIPSLYTTDDKKEEEKGDSKVTGEEGGGGEKNKNQKVIIKTLKDPTYRYTDYIEKRNKILLYGGKNKHNLLTNEEYDEKEKIVYKKCKRLSKESQKIVTVNMNLNTCNFSSTPMLFVPKNLFLNILNFCIRTEMGEEIVNQYKNYIYDKTYRVKNDYNTLNNNKLYSSNLTNKKSIHEKIIFGQIREDAGKGEEEKKRKKNNNMHTNRFIEQIERYLSKKKENEMVRRLIKENKEKEYNTFKPKINKTLPLYLKKYIQEGKNNIDNKYSNKDMLILRKYCNYFTEDNSYLKLIDDIRECTFQPNIDKYIKREKRLKEKKKKKNIFLEDDEKNKEEKKVFDVNGGGQEENNIYKRLEGRKNMQTGAGYDEDEENIKSKRNEKKTMEDVYELLDRPLLKIFESSIDVWMEKYSILYTKQKDDKMNKNVDGCGDGEGGDSHHMQSASDTELLSTKKDIMRRLYPWKAEGREPQYKILREMEKSNQNFVFDENQKKAEKQKHDDNKTKANSGAKKNIKWEDDLRGGYIKSYLNFSLEKNDEEDKIKETNKKINKNQTDWGKYIRLSGRNMEAKILPNFNLAEQMCQSHQLDFSKPEVTLYTHSRRYELRENRGPDAETYTHFKMANLDKGRNQIERRRGGGEGERSVLNLKNTIAHNLPHFTASPCPPHTTTLIPPVHLPTSSSPYDTKAYVDNFPSPKKTTFTVHTPPKIHQQRAQLRLYGQLRRAIELGEIPPPPQIVAVKKDELKVIEKALRPPPPLILNYSMRYNKDGVEDEEEGDEEDEEEEEEESLYDGGVGDARSAEEWGENESTTSTGDGYEEEQGARDICKSTKEENEWGEEKEGGGGREDESMDEEGQMTQKHYTRHYGDGEQVEEEEEEEVEEDETSGSDYQDEDEDEDEEYTKNINKEKTKSAEDRYIKNTSSINCPCARATRSNFQKNKKYEKNRKTCYSDYCKSLEYAPSN